MKYVKVILPYVTEYVACAAFHLVGSSAATAYANAAILTVLVYVSANISNGQLNPLVSLMFCSLGYINPIQMMFYWFSQVAGCATGALILNGLTPPGGTRSLGCVNPDPTLNIPRIVVWEATASFIFLIPIFSVVWCTQHKLGYGSTGPIIVGTSLLAACLMAEQWTGPSVNPARTLGSHIVLLCATNEYVVWYIVGEFVGSFAALMAVFALHGVSPEPWYSLHKSLNETETAVETTNGDSC